MENKTMGQERLAPTGQAYTTAKNPDRVVFPDVDSAVLAAAQAQQIFHEQSLELRRAVIETMRRICIANADHWGRKAGDETNSVGCDYCHNTGYRGRIGIHELLACSDDIKSPIKKKEEIAIIRTLVISEGMTTLKQEGILKVLQGLTDIHEIRPVCIR